LYEKRGLKIHSILLKEGLTDAKLFGEFKCKSLLLLAKGLAERGEYVSAIDTLKQALDVITKYTADSSDSKANLHSQQKEVKRLYASCVQRKKALKEKEKQRAQAMFAASPSKESKESPVAPKQASTNRTSIVSPSPEPREPTETTALDMSKDDLEQESEDVSDNAIPFKKRVSFANDTKQGSREMLLEEVDDEEEMPWYEEHKEALVMSAVAGLAALSVLLLRSLRK
jgi:chemotaxis protein histidine kinase CheA